MRLGRLQRLRHGGWRMLIEAIRALASARLAIVKLPFERAMRRVQPVGAEFRSSPEEAATTVARVQWAVGAAARRVPWRALCLEQALAAQHMLARRRVAATVHYGVAQTEEGLQAHAWVRAGERDVVGCDNASEFKELTRFPREAV